MTAEDNVSTTREDLVEAGARHLLRAEEATSYEDAVAAALTGIGYALLANVVRPVPTADNEAPRCEECGHLAPLPPFWCANPIHPQNRGAGQR